jgi:hypothetical protein
VERHANRPDTALILGIRAKRQRVNDIKALRALQAIDETHDASVVSVHGGVNIHFGHSAIGKFLLLAGQTYDLKAGLFGDIIEF